MKTFEFGRLLSALLFALTVAGCSGGSEDGKGDAGDTDAAPMEPTFTAIYNGPFFDCAAPMCHGVGTGMLFMRTRDEAYEQLVNQPAQGEAATDGGAPGCGESGLTRVVPGKPDESLLMMKITWDPYPTCGDVMPNSAPLADADIENVRRWIELGAKDD